MISPLTFSYSSTLILIELSNPLVKSLFLFLFALSRASSSDDEGILLAGLTRSLLLVEIDSSFNYQGEGTSDESLWASDTTGKDSATTNSSVFLTKS